jgi:hypothetical protein
MGGSQFDSNSDLDEGLELEVEPLDLAR